MSMEITDDVGVCLSGRWDEFQKVCAWVRWRIE